MAGKLSLRSPWVPRLALGVVALMLTGMILAIAIGEGGPRAQEIGDINPVQQRFGGIEQQGTLIGPSDSEVVVSVFTDLRCPSCAAYQVDVIDPLVDKYARTGELAIELRPYSFVAEAVTLPALAAVAAGNQDRAWQYADLLFRNLEMAGAEADHDFLRLIAEAIPHLDVVQWDRDLEADETRARVEADERLGADLEIPPTGPSVVVDGPGGMVTLTDAPTAAAIEAAIDDVSA